MNQRSLIPLLLLLCQVLCAEDAPSTPPPPKRTDPYYLITDYLPPAVYTGDPMTCCFRVENTTADAVAMELVVSIQDEAGKEIKVSAEPVTAAAKSTQSVQVDLSSEDGAAVEFSLRMKGKTETLARAGMRIVRDSDPWPKTALRSGRLETPDKGQVIVPVVRKRLKLHDRSYAPLKWMIDPKPGTTSVQGGNGIGFVPAGLKVSARERLKPIGPYDTGGAIPLLRAAADILDGVGKIGSGDAKSVPGRVVIMLPPEDLELATDPRSYKLLLEALLIHLKVAGVAEIIVVPPFHYGSADKHRESIWKAVHEAAEAYDCQSIDATDYANEKWWRVDPAQEGVYGARPNSAGLKMIEQGLSSLIP